MKSSERSSTGRSRSIVILIICHLAAALLYYSWYQTQEITINKDGVKILEYAAAGSGGFWKQLDYNVFGNLNGGLRDNRTAQMIWAAANNRAFDLVSAALLGLVVWISVFRKAIPEERLEQLKVGIFLLIVTVVLVQAFRFTVFDFSRLSPSLIITDLAVRLSQLDHITWTLKDTSASSFPGDHGAVLLVGVVYITYFSGRRWGALAIMVAILCALPRLIAGAHWATDILVGSTFITLVSSSWSLCLKDWQFGPRLLHRPCLCLMKIARQAVPDTDSSGSFSSPDGKE
ncbi:MAG TPA: phosphatase PAP2 family protein [Verrucomicrobiales bacterium]|nr:phosphatase PAP2 family protein [Verrucomicrobiales bacterium]